MVNPRPDQLGRPTFTSCRTSWHKKGLSPEGLRPNGWPLCGGLIGGKFGGIDLGSRLVLLLGAVEFEDAVDVNLGNPVLDGCRRFLRAVFFLVFAVTQLTLDLSWPRTGRATPRPRSDATLSWRHSRR